MILFFPEESGVSKASCFSNFPAGSGLIRGEATYWRSSGVDKGEAPLCENLRSPILFFQWRAPGEHFTDALTTYPAQAVAAADATVIRVEARVSAEVVQPRGPPQWSLFSFFLYIDRIQNVNSSFRNACSLE